MTLKGFTDPAKVEMLLEFPSYAFTIAFGKAPCSPRQA